MIHGEDRGRSMLIGTMTKRENGNHVAPHPGAATNNDQTKNGRLPENVWRVVNYHQASFATAIKLREQGDIAAAKLLTEVTNTSTRAKRILRTWCDSQMKCFTSSPKEALSLILSLHLAKFQYKSLQKGARDHGHGLCPPYYKIADIRKTCYTEDMYFYFGK